MNAEGAARGAVIQTASAKERAPRARRFQAQDFAWLLFVTVLILAIPETNYNYTILVLIIGAFQIVEPRLKLFSSTGGQIAAVALKLLLSFLLVGWTHGVGSYYYPIFFIPVVSAATIFELPGVILVTAIACAGYFSFLLPRFVDISVLKRIAPDFLNVMSLRVSFFAIVAFLVYQQARAKRDQMARTQEAAQRLAEANRELRRTQASLRRSERLAALGQLTAGLAHELRNPLGTIRVSAEMLRKPAARCRPEVMDEMAENIASEVDRMNALVASFLDFARPLQLHPAEHDLASVLGDAVRDQAELARQRSVSVRVADRDKDVRFTFDRDLLRLALSNLIGNAIEASTPGQVVDVQVGQDRDSVSILVSDNGEGIRKENLESIFNPFFTTKQKGIGLGLALVAKIVDEHGGRIEVSSEPGRGTRFELSLPKS